MLLYPIIASVTFGGLLYAIKTENIRLNFLFKPLTSLMFVLTAWSAELAGDYAPRLFIGFILCLIGDVALIPKSRTWFSIGLVSFLLAHVAFTFAFGVVAYFGAWSLLVAALNLLIASVFLAWIWPHLGEMRAPVIAYMTVISVMVWSAWAVFFTPGLPLTARLLVAVGATSFYFSDMFTARNVFVKFSFGNRAMGLLLYYVGQFLLAFSAPAVSSP